MFNQRTKRIKDISSWKEKKIKANTLAIFYIVIIKASHWWLKAILNMWVRIHHPPGATVCALCWGYKEELQNLA